MPEPFALLRVQFAEQAIAESIDAAPALATFDDALADAQGANEDLFGHSPVSWRFLLWEDSRLHAAAGGFDDLQDSARARSPVADANSCQSEGT
jgi:hypothetical protein